MQPQRGNGYNWRTEYSRVVEVLKNRLGNRETCSDIIDAYEEVLRSIWDFSTRLLGEAGARAVLARSVQLAARTSPLLQKVRTRDRGADFGELRAYIAVVNCSPAEVIDALMQLGVTVFQTLSDLAGAALTGPLLRRLEEEQ